MLDNDLIRLNQRVNVVLSLRDEKNKNVKNKSSSNSTLLD